LSISVESPQGPQGQGKPEKVCRINLVRPTPPQITRVPPPSSIVPPPPTPTYTRNPPPDKHHHGCSKGCKTTWIIIGVVAAGAGGFFALRGHGKEKVPGTPAGAGVSF